MDLQEMRARAELALAHDPISKWHAATAQDGDECGPIPEEYVTGEVLAEYPPDQYNENPGIDFLFNAESPELARYFEAFPPRVVLGLLDQLEELSYRQPYNEEHVYIDASGDYCVHTEHGWQVVEGGELTILFSPRNGRGGFDSQVIWHQAGINGPWRLVKDQAEADRARAIVAEFNTSHQKAWARRARKKVQA